MGRNSRGFLTGITTWWRKKIIAVRHSFYRKRLVRRLTNLAPSILSLDCVGGVMAHDLRLRFNSPTVNLFFESCGDFIDYVASTPPSSFKASACVIFITLIALVTASYSEVW